MSRSASAGRLVALDGSSQIALALDGTLVDAHEMPHEPAAEGGKLRRRRTGIGQRFGELLFNGAFDTTQLLVLGH